MNINTLKTVIFEGTRSFQNKGGVSFENSNPTMYVPKKYPHNLFCKISVKKTIIVSKNSATPPSLPACSVLPYKQEGLLPWALHLEDPHITNGLPRWLSG